MGESAVLVFSLQSERGSATQQINDNILDTLGGVVWSSVAFNPAHKLDSLHYWLACACCRQAYSSAQPLFVHCWLVPRRPNGIYTRKDAASPARGADGPLASQLQEGNDGAHPVSRHIRVGAVVEGRPDPGNHRSSKRVAAPIQPVRAARATTWGPVNGIGAQAGESAAGEQTRRFGLRLLSLPQGGQAREIVEKSLDQHRIRE